MVMIRRYRLMNRQAVWDLHHTALRDVGAHLGVGPWDDDLRDIERVYLDGYTAHGYVKTGVGSVGPFTVLYFEKVLAPAGARRALSVSSPLCRGRGGW